MIISFLIATFEWWLPYVFMILTLLGVPELRNLPFGSHLGTISYFLFVFWNHLRVSWEKILNESQSYGNTWLKKYQYTNQIYDIGTEILMFHCFATKMLKSFCKSIVFSGIESSRRDLAFYSIKTRFKALFKNWPSWIRSHRFPVKKRKKKKNIFDLTFYSTIS